MSQISPLPRHRVPLPWGLFSKILDGKKKAEVLRASRLGWLTPKYRPSSGFKRRLFERFTEEATTAIMLAEEESRRLLHVGVGTDAILLGLLLATETIASKVLGSMKINPKDVKVEADKISGRYTTPIKVEKRTVIAPISFPFTDPALRLLELTYEEARKLGHNYIGSGHLLLGLLSDEGCLAASVLAKLGANAGDIRTEVIRMIGENNNETILELSSYQPTVEDVAKVDEEIKALENEQSQMSKESREAFAGRDFKKGILLGDRKHAIGREISALVSKRITLSMWT